MREKVLPGKQEIASRFFSVTSVPSVAEMEFDLVLVAAELR
jgi:hypothetical protein